MDVREKLVKLIDDFHRDLSPFAGNEKLFVVDDNVEQAEYLIAHGVTVQKWISVKDRLPEDICSVLVVLEGLNIAFNGWYNDGKWWTVGAGTRPFTRKVTHWMPLPQPPKGERRIDA